MLVSSISSSMSGTKPRIATLGSRRRCSSAGGNSKRPQMLMVKSVDFELRLRSGSTSIGEIEHAVIIAGRAQHADVAEDMDAWRRPSAARRSDEPSVAKASGQVFGR